VELLYFDFDHGMERLLFIHLSTESQTVEFRLEKGPDPTHDEESEDVPTETVTASTKCSSVEQFRGFCHALVAAMRHSSFSLQDPDKRPFAAMPQEAFVLRGIEEGVPPMQLTCRITDEIAAELVGPDYVPESFRRLIGPHG